MKLRLYHYWRSTSSWRVRWAFALKGMECEYIPVNLLSDEPESEAHLARNPLGYVPALVVERPGKPPLHLAESLAIIEWSEELKPAPPLLPGDADQRAKIRMIAEMINADTHPLQNLNPQLLHSEDPEERKQWARHWIKNGLQACETVVSKTAGQFAVGDSVTLADLCLVPQMYNARRYDVALDAFPTLLRIEAACKGTEGYQASEPGRFQPNP